MKKLKKYLLFLFIFLLTACGTLDQSSTIERDKLEVHFLDVGQADCSLIMLPTGENILVDGGNKDDKDYIEEYLKNNGVEHINAVVATHPHEDHIGSLRYIISDFRTDTIFMPEIDADTLVYTNLLYSIEENDVEEIRVSNPTFFDFGEAKFEIFTPVGEYEDKNNSSIVFKMKYGNTSFLFTGDIEKEAERDLLSSKADLNADVLKVAHHGSQTSSIEDFLKVVDPQIAVIQVGKNNDYNLPSNSVIDRLKNMNLSLYRTDENKEVIIYSDGDEISALCNEGKPYEGKLSSTKELVNKSDEIVGNKNTKVYHLTTCPSLPSEVNRVYFTDKKEAEKEGYKGHKNCVK